MPSPKLEAELLNAYFKDHPYPGLALREVAIAGSSKVYGGWSAKGRLDGVYVLGHPGPAGYVKPRRVLRELPRNTEIELIEVKPGLSEHVIGQCVAGREMLAKEHPHLKIVRTVAVTKFGDPDLVRVCEELDVRAHRVGSARPNKPMKSRAKSLWNDEWRVAIEPLKDREGGRFISRVPLGLTSANVVRVLGQPAELVDFDALPNGFGEQKRLEIEIIEYRKTARRGVIGRILSHAILLERTYGVKVVRKRVLVGSEDAAVAYACAALGIEVQLIEA